MAWYEDRVLVPADALKFRDSAPPKIFRSCTSAYAEPSVFPTSVPVFAENRPRSSARRKTSISVTVVLGSVGDGRSMNVDIGSLKIPMS